MYMLLIFLTISYATCDNVTDYYNSLPKEKFQSRQNRFLTFNTKDDGFVSMELAFNVPFISIPVKKSLDMAQGAVANVNIGAVILAGSMAFALLIIVPGIISLISKKMQQPNKYRDVKTDTQAWWQYLNVLDQALSENGMDTTSCLQRVVCWSVKNSSQNLAKNRASSVDKIIDGVSTSDFFKYLVKGSVIEAPIEYGLLRNTSAVNCAEKYKECKITQKSMHVLMKKFAENINGAASRQ